MINTKERVTAEFRGLVKHLFQYDEIDCIKVRGITIGRDFDNISEAVEAVYHDKFSDIDLSVVVKRSPEETTSEFVYMKQKERFGFTQENCLGIAFVPENKMIRVVLKNGMRYDFGFQFFEESGSKPLELKCCQEKQDNKDWPVTKVDQFWFVQIQALAKLYRKDYLIGDHLANLNINETLVQQMVMRDIQYGTNHHRYGYSEKLTYAKYEGKCPYKKGNEIADRIAEKIYCAALAYDELTTYFYPEREPRSEYFFRIWNDYAE